MDINKVLCGNSLDVLKTLPDESIDCCITSSPYYALRDYGLEPIVWGGDPLCKHLFVSERTPFPNGSGGKTEFVKNVLAVSNKENRAEFVDYNDRATYSQICSLCGAWLGSLGLEPTPQMFIENLISVFVEVKRVLKKTGSCWCNISDTYGGSGNGSWNAPIEIRGKHGSKHYDKQGRYLESGQEYLAPPTRNTKPQAKSLLGVPEMFVLAMQNIGFIRRNTIIWHKKSAMPSSARDRFTNDFEYFYFFTKSQKYYFKQQFEPFNWDTMRRSKCRYSSQKLETDSYAGLNNEASVKYAEKLQSGAFPGRNKRTVWSISHGGGYKGAHFATFPLELVRTPIDACVPKGGIVLDPFCGSGTVGVVAKQMNRNYILIDANPTYCLMSEERIANDMPKPAKSTNPKPIPDKQLTLF